MGAFDLKVNSVDLKLSRWGNSLAVRLPAGLVESLGVFEGSELSVKRNADNSITLVPKIARKQFNKAKWMQDARKHLATMPSSPSVIREIRDSARY
jgi:antitoxin MazE